MKRISELWGKRFHRGYILWVPRLTDALRFSDYVEYNGAMVTTKDLRRVLASIGTQDLLIRSNGGLEITPVERLTRENPDGNPPRIFAHRLAKNADNFYIKPKKKIDGVGVIMKIKIRPYGRNNKRKRG